MSEMDGAVKKPIPKRQRVRDEMRTAAMELLNKTDLVFREVTRGVVVFEICNDAGKACKATWYITKGRIMANSMKFDEELSNEKAVEWILAHTK